MQHKSFPLLIKSADDQGGTCTGLASVFDNLDYDGDICSSRCLQQVTRWRHTPIPPVSMHEADDPRCYVGDVVEATETDDVWRSRAGLISTPSSARRPTETPRAAQCQV